MVIDLVDDIFKGNCDNYDKVRGCSLASSMYCLRTPSLFSSHCDEDYTIRVQRESDRMVKNDPVTSTNSLQLEYMSSKS